MLGFARVHACRCPSFALCRRSPHTRTTAPCRWCRERALALKQGGFWVPRSRKNLLSTRTPTSRRRPISHTAEDGCTAGPGPVLSESGDSESRFVYFDANDPIVAALPFAEWQPAPAGAAAIPMLQIGSPTLTRILIPRTKVRRAAALKASGDSESRVVYFDANDPIAAFFMVPWFLYLSLSLKGQGQ